MEHFVGAATASHRRRHHRKGSDGGWRRPRRRGVRRCRRRLPSRLGRSGGEHVFWIIDEDQKVKHTHTTIFFFLNI